MITRFHAWDNLGLFLFVTLVTYWLVQSWLVTIPFYILFSFYLLVQFRVKFFRKWYWRLYFKHFLIHRLRKLGKSSVHSPITYLVLVRAELASEEEYVKRSDNDYLGWLISNVEPKDTRTYEEKSLNEQSDQVYREMTEEDPNWNARRLEVEEFQGELPLEKPFDKQKEPLLYNNDKKEEN